MENAGTTSDLTQSERPIEDRLLYATSFGPDMWEATGRNLVASFYKTQSSGEMLVSYEGFKYKGAGDRELKYNLDKDVFLHTFLRENADVIPIHLGGETTQCDCKDSHEMHCKHHIHGCYWHWMNRNASRWFRKVATLRHAASLPYRYVLWVDSDSALVADVSMRDFITELHGKSFFYFRAHRPAPEVGLVGFDMANGGREAVAAICNRYESREYLGYERWDDGFIWGTLIDENLVNAHDACGKSRLNHNHVMMKTKWWNFVRHDKGAHGRQRLEKGKHPIMR